MKSLSLLLDIVKNSSFLYDGFVRFNLISLLLRPCLESSLVVLELERNMYKSRSIKRTQQPAENVNEKNKLDFSLLLFFFAPYTVCCCIHEMLPCSPKVPRELFLHSTSRFTLYFHELYITLYDLEKRMQQRGASQKKVAFSVFLRNYIDIED